MAKCEHARERGTCSLCEPEQVFRRYQRAAKDRELKFGLTLEQFKEIVFRPCVFCGKYGSPRGIDRKDNFQGYIPGNCQACCARCNRYKSNDQEDGFLWHVREICEHQEKLKKAKLLNKQAEALARIPVASAEPEGPVAR